jgi:hypothetical protein
LDRLPRPRPFQGPDYLFLRDYDSAAAFPKGDPMRPYRAVWIALIVLSFLGCQDRLTIDAVSEEPEKTLTDADKQAQTVRDMRDLGTALFSWLTDQLGAMAAGQPQIVNLKLYPEISGAALEKLLIPAYLAQVPKTDAWGHPLEVGLNVKDLLAQNVISIRSPGRDGKYSANLYKMEQLRPGDYDQDLVWADGFFIRWPSRKN